MKNETAVLAVNKFRNYMFSPCSPDKQKERDELYAIITEEHENQIRSITVPSYDASPILHPTWKERLFLWYIAGKPVSNPRIGIYWYLEMKVFDYQELIDRLAASGLITTIPISESLPKLSLDQLRTIAKQNDIPSSGTKATLVDIINRNLSADYLNKSYSSFSKFSLTPSGKELVDASNALIFYHQNRNRIDPSFSYKNIEKYVSKYPSLTPLCAILLREIQNANNKDELIKSIFAEYRRREQI